MNAHTGIATNPALGPATNRSGGSIALDQWRGLALLLVLISHGFYFTHRVAGAGRIGVNLFFFISGILVFRSMIHAKSTGRQLLTRFWWKRFRRLYPALMAYLILILVLLTAFRVFKIRLPNSDLRFFTESLPLAIFYLTDYATHIPLTMGHLWSLAVEAQFYCLAPIIYIIGQSNKRRQLWVFGSILLIFVSYGFMRPLHSANLELVRYRFEVAVWPMMLGFFCESAKNHFLHLNNRAVRQIFLLGVASLPIALAVMVAFPNTKILVISIGTFLLFPCFLAYLFEMPFTGTWGRSLMWLGERTYSIYLLQQPLSIVGFVPNAVQPIGAFAATFVGAIWFRIFEEPFLSGSRAKQINSAVPSRAL